MDLGSWAGDQFAKKLHKTLLFLGADMIRTTAPKGPLLMLLTRRKCACVCVCVRVCVFV